MTLIILHSARGLELPWVYSSDMDGELFPEMISVSSDDPAGLEEEWRLCYMGITRAKKNPATTSSRRRMVDGKIRYSRVSQFVDEIPEELLEAGRPEPRLFSRGDADKTCDDGLPWNGTKKPAGVSSFGTKSNAYTSKIMSSGQPALGKAFMAGRTKRLDY